MPIVFNSKLSSQVANDTFLDKTQDDETVGLLCLNETLSGNSGSKVANPQRQLNIDRKVVFGQSSVSAGATLSPDALSVNQEFRLIGDAGAISMNVLPFGSSQVVLDGCEIHIFGHDDTNTVTFTHNDVQYGLLLNGNATLQRGFCIKLIYNNELERYIEVARNF